MFSVQTIRGSITIVLTDAIITYLIFGIVLPILPGSPEWLTYSSWYGHLIFSVFTLIIILVLSAARLYAFREYILPIELVRRTITAFMISFGAIATLGFFIKDLALINWRLLPSLGIIYVCLFLFRNLLFYGLQKNRERVLILGTTDQAREIIKASKSKKIKGYGIVGIITTLEGQVGKDLEEIPVLGLIENMEEILREYAVDNIVITLRDRRGKLPVRELLKSKVGNIRIQEGSSFYEKIIKKTNIDEFLKPSWFVFEDGFYHTSLLGFIKHIQGIMVSLILLTLLSPLLLLVAILIKLESPGSVFFLQERVGLNGKIFNLIKFRSMYIDAESMTGPKFAQKNDPRITRLGRIIRKLRLDEVPQFINIFKGDMDMVGPRPERPIFVKQLEERVPYYNLRHTVRPGLTGWAQINYPYGDSLEDGKEKLQYDLYYVKYFSWYLDVLIIFLTIKEVLFGKGQ